MNALRAITYGGGPFSIDMNALRAIVYGGGPFAIDMNALWAIAEISRRETISIELICRMNYVVRRTLTTKSERKFHNVDLKFLTPHPPGGNSNPSLMNGEKSFLIFLYILIVYRFQSSVC